MKKILTFSTVMVFSVLLSGCSLTTPPAQNNQQAPKIVPEASFLRSSDNAVSWESKIRIDDKTSIANQNVLSMAVHPSDPNVVYLGTESGGLFVTKDGGETWKHLDFADKAYGIVFDRKNPSVMYATGVFNKRGKIYKKETEDQPWKEIYTEPADGTIMSSLAIDPSNTQILYAGTNQGVIIKSTNGGQTWFNIKNIVMPVINIAIDARNTSQVYFGAFQQALYRTKDGGATVEDITQNFDKTNSRYPIYTVVADPSAPGLVYVGTDHGIFRSFNNGDDWGAVKIIESSKVFPIRAIVINPRNSREILYVSAKALYQSKDAGNQWATFQLDTKKDIGIMRYNAVVPNVLYAGLRNF